MAVVYEYIIPNRPARRNPRHLYVITNKGEVIQGSRRKAREVIDAAAFNKGKMWIAEEIRKVKYSNKTTAELARDLGRTVSAWKP